MKVKINFIVDALSVIELKPVFHANEFGRGRHVKRALPEKRRRSVGCGEWKNQPSGLLLKTKQSNINQERELYV
jgi:hypothetical protein